MIMVRLKYLLPGKLVSEGNCEEVSLSGGVLTC